MKNNAGSALTPIARGANQESIRMVLRAIYDDKSHAWEDEVLPGINFMMLAGILIAALKLVPKDDQAAE